LPIVVGGSGMYINSLIDGISATPIISDEIRHIANKDFATDLKEDFVEKMLKLFHI
jgi:tRNA A37 N6-isopentenylltransferase MiaA